MALSSSKNARKYLDGKPIIFSEWKSVSGRVLKVQRIEYTFDSIIEEGAPNGSVSNHLEQASLFSSNDTNPVKLPKKQYVIVKWTDIYQKRVIER